MKQIGTEKTITAIAAILLLLTGTAYAISSVDQGFQAGWFIGDIANGTIGGLSVSSLISSLQGNDTADRSYVNDTFLPISTYSGDFPNSTIGGYVGDFPNSTVATNVALLDANNTFTATGTNSFTGVVSGAEIISTLFHSSDGGAASGSDITIRAGNSTTNKGGFTVIEAGSSDSGVQGSLQLVDSWNGTATLNGIACSTDESSTVEDCTAGTTTGLIGVALTTSTPVKLVVRGTSLVLSDNNASVGDNFCLSLTENGKGHSNGDAICPPGTVLGVVRSITELTSLGQATATLPLVSVGIIPASQAGSTGNRIVNGVTDTVLETDNGKWVIYNSTSDTNVLIPCPTSTSFGRGWMGYFKNANTGIVNITKNDGCYIDNQYFITVFLPPGQGIIFESDGTNYYTQRSIGATLTPNSIPFYSDFYTLNTSSKFTWDNTLFKLLVTGSVGITGIYSGNGSGLHSINVSNITGTIPTYNSTYDATTNTVNGNLVNWNATYNATYAATTNTVNANLANWNATYNASYETTSLNFIVSNGTNAIATGIKGDVEIPFTGTIITARALGDQTGSINVSYWKDTYANYPPTAADILGYIAIAAGTKAESTGLSQAITAGDILRFNVESNDVVTRATISLTIRRS